ncbi:3'-5' exonuclease [Lacihabitans sp. LS3-19]|uniref:3'-5' exonuclease n=1 Tax=Lacihabitans sp. LS3-19 TaxID=2487335 RepID=UPI0020CF4794|nr:3'-5' exonuclease [Lacihabitans sp. LS3-19]MCP9767319.1 3'-5' exonuclease [Lacihabitans sp. LS3-19]
MGFFSWFNTYKKTSELPEVKSYLESFKGNSDIFVVFDTETTGLNPSKDQMVSIGAVKVIGSSILVNDSFYFEIKQPNSSNEGVSVHEIIENQKSKEVNWVLLEFLNFIKNATLVGHHVAFDIEMVNQALIKHFGIKLKNISIDTSHLAIKKDHYGKIPDAYKRENYTLDKLCEKYKIETKDRHHALGDAFITAELFFKLK